jgi:hypothetical protein
LMCSWPINSLIISSLPLIALQLKSPTRIKAGGQLGYFSRLPGSKP